MQGKQTIYRDIKQTHVSTCKLRLCVNTVWYFSTDSYFSSEYNTRTDYSICSCILPQMRCFFSLALPFFYYSIFILAISVLYLGYSRLFCIFWTSSKSSLSVLLINICFDRTNSSSDTTNRTVLIVVVASFFICFFSFLSFFLFFSLSWASILLLYMLFFLSLWMKTIHRMSYLFWFDISLVKKI